MFLSCSSHESSISTFYNSSVSHPWVVPSCMQPLFASLAPLPAVTRRHDDATASCTAKNPLLHTKNLTFMSTTHPQTNSHGRSDIAPRAPPSSWWRSRLRPDTRQYIIHSDRRNQPGDKAVFLVSPPSSNMALLTKFTFYVEPQVECSRNSGTVWKTELSKVQQRHCS